MKTGGKLIKGKHDVQWPWTVQKKVTEWEATENNCASGHVNKGQ